MKLRGETEPPFCWQSKTALRLIRQALDEEKTARAAVMVYGALCEVASDYNNLAEFQVAMRKLETISCYTRRTIDKALKNLVRLRIVEVRAAKTEHGFSDWNVYRLLSVDEFVKLKKRDATVIPDDDAIANRAAMVARLPATELNHSMISAVLSEETIQNNEKESAPARVEEPAYLNSIRRVRIKGKPKR